MTSAIIQALKRTWLHPLGITLVIAGAYYLLAILGEVYVIGNTGVSPFWPPAGLSLGLLILMGPRVLPGITLGAFMAALESYYASGVTQPVHLFLSALIIAFSIGVQAYLGERVVRLAMGGQVLLESLESGLRFLLCMPVVALISATLGLTLLNLIPGFAYYKWSQFSLLWRIWWFADVAGLMVVTPIVVLVNKQNYASERNRFIFLTFLLCLILLVVTSATLTLLYRNYLHTHEQRLYQLAISQANTFNAVARFDKSGNTKGNPNGWRSATLSQIDDAYRHLPGFGDTGEFEIGRLSGDAIQITLAPRFGGKHIRSIPINRDQALAEPMRRALKGESGVMQGLDYRGKHVLAAYTPISALNIGLVMKTDMDEINGPFIATAQTSSVIAAILIAIAIIIFGRVSRPVIRRLERTNRELSTLVQERTVALEQANAEIADRLIFQQVLIDTIPNPVFYKDEQARFLGINQAFEAAFGVQARQLIGRQTLDSALADYFGLTGEYNPEKHQELDMKVIAGKKFEPQELKLKFCDGRLHDVLYEIAGVKKKDGSPAGLVGIIIDITEQKETLRQLLEARDAAEKTTQAKARFLASMSHEIRTPLNGIIGFIELLAKEPLSSRQEKMLQLIAESGEVLLTLINDILDFSKIESGELVLDNIVFDVEVLIEGLADTMQALASSRSLQLVTIVDPAIDHLLVGDVNRLRQILLNFTSNAIKFSEHAAVILRAELVSCDQTSMRVKFSVRDEGIGIPDAMRERLFLPFIQADAATAREYGGTGLGLAISKQLCELMGGSIGVDSRQGEGSTFHVTVPFEMAGPALRAASGQWPAFSVTVVTPSAVEGSICREYLQPVATSVEICSDLAGMQFASRSAEHTVAGILILGAHLPDADVERIEAKLNASVDNSGPLCVELRTGADWQEPVWMSRRRLVIAGCPLKRSSLINAIAIATGQKSMTSVERNHRAADSELDHLGRSATGKKRGTILVVEDNPVNREIIRHQLQSLGYECAMVTNGREAVDIWKQEDYLLILTDCDMPEMDGYALARQIRSLEDDGGEADGVPIIAITANAVQGDAEKCFAAGMSDYVTKPLKLDILKRKLEKWLPEVCRESS